MVLNLQVMALLAIGVKQPFYHGFLKPLDNMDICILIPRSSKIIFCEVVTKVILWLCFITTWGIVVKDHSIRKVENHGHGQKWLLLPATVSSLHGHSTDWWSLLWIPSWTLRDSLICWLTNSSFVPPAPKAAPVSAVAVSAMPWYSLSAFYQATNSSP